MTTSITAVSGALFPYLPVTRVLRRVDDEDGSSWAKNRDDEIADHPYAHPLRLPPGSSGLFASVVEDASATSAPADAFDILARDFRRLMAVPATGRRMDDYA